MLQVRLDFHMRSTGRLSNALGAMSVVETEASDARVAGLELFLWRLQRALAMGFEKRLADRIAATAIDLHQLERLIDSGCPRGTAYRILLP